MNKYRAWDKENKEMYVVYGWNESTNEIYIRSLPESAFKGGMLHTTHVVTKQLDKYILMQSTGLKDKNGVEIFEGDILSGWISSHWHSGIDKFLEVVTYDNSLCRYNFDGRDVDVNDKEYLTVIGNIHANPELLKEVE